MRKTLFAFLLLGLLSTAAVCDDKPAGAKLKALLITGGGYHDYKALNPVLTRKISELASVHFDQRSGLDVLKNKSFADGYDVLVYNFCFAAEKNKTLVEHALQATRDGKATMMIHCAMHTFMASDDWTDACGMRTRRHDAYAGFSVFKVDKKHPVVQGLPDEWRTPGDELYQTIELGKRSTALLRGKNAKTKSEHVVCWVSSYGKGKVFATTLGHDLRTVKMPEYHRLLANGLLWTCGKLGEDGKPLEGYAGGGAK
jgi:type 1 glutamine amidotransferase